MTQEESATRRSHTITVQVLDSFEVFVSGVSVTLPMQAQKVIAYLALQDGLQPRARVAEKVWPDSDLKRCLASLRTVLWQVRQVSADAVCAKQTAVGLGSAVQVDIRESRDVVRRVLDGATVDPEQAVRLLSRKLLPDWDEDWVLLEQERVQLKHVYALEALSRQLVDHEHYAYAMEAAAAAARIEPFRESAQRAVIDVYLAEGNAAQARKVYEVFRLQLRAELGLEPSARLAAALAEVPRQAGTKSRARSS